MKKLLLLGLAVILFTSCQNEQRYFTESPEITSFKTSLEQYKNGDWDAWSAHFADTAKFFVNSNKSVNIDDFKKGQLNLLSNFSSYGFIDQGSFMEMVLDSDDETWVNYWATWRGKLKANDKEIDIPVHITSEYVDGKVVQLYNYWDSAPITQALSEIEKANNMPVEDKAIIAKVDTFVNEFLNKQNTEVLKDGLADNYVRYMNDVKVASNPQELVESMSVFFTGFPDFKITNPHRSPIFNNTIFVHWEMTGTNTGEFAGSPPTGKKVKISGLSRLHFNGDGKLDEENVFYDQLNLMQQLGKTLN
ncbi:ester cyclase [Yeosuana sp. MJ-SS3]|uniref:Ester cyclase n=1 Tax=Gilvirhabdus luticola TaxID=3079858 RepID=A0ABU3U992_9FLAO|nr:ester cyclase [Yeosuana sp. MJ-SS3]MDU8886955.1 ester cyclase [Yeosuana sp. MJ-SS3]